VHRSFKSTLQNSLVAPGASKSEARQPRGRVDARSRLPGRPWLTGAAGLHCDRMTSADSPTEIVTVQRIAPGGEGIARLSTGQIVFVPRSAPGDELELTETVQRKGLAYAKRVRLRKPGPGRTPPICPHAEQCGGCDFMHLDEHTQKQAKLEMLEDALRRVGNNPHGGVGVEFVSSAQNMGYRTRVRLHTDEHGLVGFVAARSNRIADIDRCPVATARINQTIARIARAQGAERRLLSFCEQIELRETTQEPQLLARLIPRQKAKLRAELYADLFPPATRVVVAGTPDDEQATQRFALPANVEMLAPAASFTQVNPAVNHTLVAAALDAAARHGACTFLDAYAGAGNFTLPLLASGLTGEAIDIQAVGIYSARGVARDRGWPFDGFQVGDARARLDALVRARRRFDLVLLDPPREGAKGVLQPSLQLEPKLVLLVACDPVALARDLKLLVEAGGRVETLTVFDMFPQTHHFETLAAVTMPSR